MLGALLRTVNEFRCWSKRSGQGLEGAQRGVQFRVAAPGNTLALDPAPPMFLAQGKLGRGGERKYTC